VEDGKGIRRRFKSYPIGYFHIDIAEVRTAMGRLYLFVAMNRSVTPLVYRNGQTRS
jgi:hypothetical protein